MQEPILTDDVRRRQKNQHKSQPWRAIHAWRRRNVGRLSGFIPAPRATETKTITPVIHVLHEACFARSGKLARQNDLQVTDSTLLEIVTASIAIELRSSRRRHADNVGGLVEQRVNRCVISNKDLITDNTCFRFSPEAPVDRLTARNQFD